MKQKKLLLFAEKKTKKKSNRVCARSSHFGSHEKKVGCGWLERPRERERDRERERERGKERGRKEREKERES